MIGLPIKWSERMEADPTLTALDAMLAEIAELRTTHADNQKALRIAAQPLAVLMTALSPMTADDYPLISCENEDKEIFTITVGQAEKLLGLIYGIKPFTAEDLEEMKRNILAIIDRHKAINAKPE